MGVFKTISRFVVVPAYPDLEVLRIKYFDHTSFPISNVFRMFLGFVGSPRDFLGFSFLPPFDHAHHLVRS